VISAAGQPPTLLAESKVSRRTFRSARTGLRCHPAASESSFRALPLSLQASKLKKLSGRIFLQSSELTPELLSTTHLCMCLRPDRTPYRVSIDPP
jgi:hypothetical protein